MKEGRKEWKGGRKKGRRGERVEGRICKPIRVKVLTAVSLMNPFLLYSESPTMDQIRLRTGRTLTCSQQTLIYILALFSPNWQKVSLSPQCFDSPFFCFPKPSLPLWSLIHLTASFPTLTSLINNSYPEPTTNKYIETLETFIVQRKSKTAKVHW